MTTILTIELDKNEYTALLSMARAELRSPTFQARYLLRRELYLSGFLRKDYIVDYPPPEDESAE